MFSGEHLEIDQVRQSELDAIYGRHPERFIQGRPAVRMAPVEVCINPVPENAEPGTPFKKASTSEPATGHSESN